MEKYEGKKKKYEGEMKRYEGTVLFSVRLHYSQIKSFAVALIRNKQ